MKAVGGFNRSLNPTSSSKGDKKNPASFTVHSTRTILFSTLKYGVILLLNSIRHFLTAVEKKLADTVRLLFVYIHTSLNQIIFSDTSCKPKC